MTLTLTSTAFGHGGEIPARCTCEGKDASPDLAWTGLPESTKALALIVDDPDAPTPRRPKMTYVHWVLYNIPAGPQACRKGSPPPGCRRARSRESMTGSAPATAALAPR